MTLIEVFAEIVIRHLEAGEEKFLFKNIMHGTCTINLKVNQNMSIDQLYRQKNE
jgi:hypothetical protein